MDLKVVDTLFDPSSSEKVIVFRERGTKRLYKVWLYLEGLDLPYVERVEYILHSSFRNRVRKVSRRYSNQNCAHPLWTWGLFDVQVRVFMKNGEKKKRRHNLRYDYDLTEPGVTRKVEG